MAEGLSASHPEAKVLYMSGYVNDINELLVHGHTFIDKPFSPDALLRRVREVFDQTSKRRQSA